MWEYETDENPKRKHHWNRNEAGHLEVQGVLVSKCPANLSNAEAEALLNEGIPFYPPSKPQNGHPRRIYAVLNGVVYRATPTNPGTSYHGFPELRENLPPHRFLHRAIMERARLEGKDSEEAVRKWLK